MEKNLAAKIDISYFDLRLIAIIAMFIDHLGYIFFPDAIWMRIVGRLAFPIFAFQIAEGFSYTSDFVKYCNRLFVFAFISEIPYNLMINPNMPINPFRQNVLWTLLLGLLAIKAIDEVRKLNISGVSKCLICGIITIAAYFVGVHFNLDYYGAGVLTVIVFYFGRNVEHGKIFEFLGMFYINFTILSAGKTMFFINGQRMYFSIQAFAILALIPIWLYKGNKGYSSKLWHKFCYWFYPAHMMILALIGR